jgi:hypothetical protein
LLAEITGMPRVASDHVKHAVKFLDHSGDGLVSREELLESVLEQGSFGHMFAGLSTHDVRPPSPLLCLCCKRGSLPLPAQYGVVSG